MLDFGIGQPIVAIEVALRCAETRALSNRWSRSEPDRYPFSPRIRLLREILPQCGEVGGLSPEPAARLRRYTSPPPAPQPPPRVYEPLIRGRFKRR